MQSTLTYLTTQPCSLSQHVPALHDVRHFQVSRHSGKLQYLVWLGFTARTQRNRVAVEFRALLRVKENHVTDVAGTSLPRLRQVFLSSLFIYFRILEQSRAGLLDNFLDNSTMGRNRLWV